MMDFAPVQGLYFTLCFMLPAGYELTSQTAASFGMKTNTLKLVQLIFPSRPEPHMKYWIEQFYYQSNIHTEFT